MVEGGQVAAVPFLWQPIYVCMRPAVRLAYCSKTGGSSSVASSESAILTRVGIKCLRLIERKAVSRADTHRWLPLLGYILAVDVMASTVTAVGSRLGLGDGAGGSNRRIGAGEEHFFITRSGVMASS